MDKITKIDWLLSEWQTATGEGHPYGLTFDQLGELAEVAVRILGGENDE